MAQQSQFDHLPVEMEEIAATIGFIEIGTSTIDAHIFSALRVLLH